VKERDKNKNLFILSQVEGFTLSKIEGLKIESGERRLDVAEMKKLAGIYKKPADYFLK